MFEIILGIATNSGDGVNISMGNLYWMLNLDILSYGSQNSVAEVIKLHLDDRYKWSDIFLFNIHLNIISRISMERNELFFWTSHF